MNWYSHFPRHLIEMKSIGELSEASGRIENSAKKNRTLGVLNGEAQLVIIQNRRTRGSS